MTKEQFLTGRADANNRLYVSSIFETVDGETNAHHAGSWSIFIRLQGCRVGCTWCDTKYSWPINKQGKHYTVDEIVSMLRFSKAHKITITGGEPMEQWGHALQDLIAALVHGQYDISMETAGTEDLWLLITHYPRVNLIVDYKLPSARAIKPMYRSNFSHLRNTDVVKFVCTLDEVALIPDIAQDLRDLYNCSARFVFSPVWSQQDQLAEFVEAARRNQFPALNIGLNLQTHKFIWPNSVRDEEGSSLFEKSNIVK